MAKNSVFSPCVTELTSKTWWWFKTTSELVKVTRDQIRGAWDRIRVRITTFPSFDLANFKKQVKSTRLLPLRYSRRRIKNTKALFTADSWLHETESVCWNTTLVLVTLKLSMCSRCWRQILLIFVKPLLRKNCMSCRSRLKDAQPFVNMLCRIATRIIL